MYPKWKYHPDKEARIVHTPEAEAALGPDWYESPADFGVETCPAVSGPDRAIAEKREKHLASKVTVLSSVKPKRSNHKEVKS